jgi:hypothetical protein
MSGGGGTTEQKTELSPEFKPYISYALQQAKDIYGNMPQAPASITAPQSAYSQQAIGMAAERAAAGSPITQAAQEQTLQTIQGRGVNPFLGGALQAAYEPTVMATQEAIRGLQGQASSAGRYGSDAMMQLAQRAGYGSGQGIGGALSQLAYGSSEAEAGRQAAAIQNAPTLAAADYADIQRLLQAGQAQESYAQQALQGQLAAQELPLQRLQQAANVFYGAPIETKSTATPQGGK